jgi:hypothetical protein
MDTGACSATSFTKRMPSSKLPLIWIITAPVDENTNFISWGEGNTPLIRLENIPALLGTDVDIYVKYTIIKLNLYFMVYSIVLKFEKIWLSGTLNIIRKHMFHSFHCLIQNLECGVSVITRSTFSSLFIVFFLFMHNNERMHCFMKFFNSNIFFMR